MKIFRHYISEEQEASGEFRAKLCEAMKDINVEEETSASKFVNLAWKDFWDKLPPWARQDEVQMRGRWFAEHCATILGKFQDTRPKVSPHFQAERDPKSLLRQVEPEDLPNINAQVKSSRETLNSEFPHKRSAEQAAYSSPKRIHTSTPQDPTELRTVADCYTLTNSNTDEHKLQCHLIHAPQAVRVIDGQNRMKGQAQTSSVLNILVADHTGPLYVDLWGSVGNKFLQDVATAAEQSEEPLPLEISYFFIRKDTQGKWLTPIVRAKSSTRTRIERRDRATQTSVEKDTTRMSSFLYVRDFSCLTKPPPFKISIAGVVQNTSRVKQSQTGKPMRWFTLHDATGRYVTCTAFGRHAGNTAIEDGNDIIVYFASGVAGRTNKPGALWLYDEAHVVALKAKRIQPRTTVHMELK